MRARFQLLNAASVVGFLLASMPVCLSDELLLPQTKLRLTVAQWNPVKGDYQTWEAISGEFAVSQAGTVQLPIIGQVQAAGRDSEELANDISTRLQSRMGFLEKPDASVEILEYPPVYVVGDVTTPGEYKYRIGMTALQALALSGGPLRQGSGRSDDEIRLVGELRGIRNDILRSKTRMARLNAEMAGASELVFPAIGTGGDDAEMAAGVEAQERIIFETRIKERERQAKSLEELRKLLLSEIDVLEQKVKAADIGVRNAREELNNVTILVEKGIAVASRRSELELALASFQADRLDQVTAIMRARQNITEATRSLEGLEDKHKTEVADALQQEQAKLQRLLLSQDVSQKLLLQTLAALPPSVEDPGAIDFVLTRSQDGNTGEIPATKSTALMPGDVVTVRARTTGSLTAVGDSSVKPAVFGPLSAADAEPMVPSR